MSAAGGAGRPSQAGPRRILVVHCPVWDAAETQDFAAVIRAVEEFCPQVELLHPGTCAIAARGPGRYFGGEERLAAKITAAVARQGIDCRTGVADGLFAALLAAGVTRSGATLIPAGTVTIVPPGGAADFLAPFGVAVLEIPELTALLPRLGLDTLGKFAALPAAEAASRFGTQGALAHRMARGLDPRPLAPRPPPADLTAECEFDPPEQQSEPVVFAAKALAGQLHASLAARGSACVRVRVQAVCADGQEITRLWRHDGLLSALAVAERVRWQLDGWRPGQSAKDDEPGARLAGGVILLRLIPDQVTRDQGRQLGLWGDAVASDRVARAAVRIQAMLGHDAVTRPVLTGGRSPGQQVLLVPFGDTAVPPLPAGRPWPGRIPAPAPATSLPEPRPALVTDDSGNLVEVSGRAQLSGVPARLSAAGGPPLEIVSWAGPWPVTERWWDPDRARRQARFQFVTDDGNARLVVVRDGHWLVEACYD